MAIDPSSKNIGWSHWERKKYVKSGVLMFSNFSEAVQCCSDLLDGFSLLDVLVVEAQYYHVNVKTLSVLTAFATIFKVLVNLRREEITINDVPPATWQAKMLGGGNIKRDERKKLSKARAMTTSGKEWLGDDEADAINLGEYFTIYGPYTRTPKKGIGKKSAGS